MVPDFIVLTVIALVTFITRAVNLLKIPIFTDEAIYIRWAQIGLADPAQRFISLTDGKQPLFTWLMYPMLKIFSDPLFAGRFVSVLSGVFTSLGIYLVTKKMFSTKAAILAAVLYIISPFFMVYDRLALYDSLLATFGIWSLYLEILLAQKPSLDVGLLLGITIGLGMLTKSSALFFALLIPFSLLLINPESKRDKPYYIKFAGFGILSFIISEIMYNLLRLSPWFYIIKQKNYSFIYTFPEFLKAPFVVFLPNLNGLAGFLFTYLTVPVDILVGAAVILGLIKINRKIIFLFIWFFIPFLALAVDGKVLFPRFILFMTIPLLIIGGHALSVISDFFKGKRKVFGYLLIIIILSYPLYQTWLLSAEPIRAAIPQNDRNQLFDDWPSGYGVREVIDFLRENSKYRKVVIGTEGTFGLNPAVYEIYLGLNKNVEIYGFWPVSEVPGLLLDKAKLYPTYLVFKEKQNIPSGWPLKLISKFRRGDGNTYLLFYQVENQSKNMLQ